MTLTTSELQERVNRICDDLYTKGEKVSVRMVLSLLPEIKSTSTAHKYVKAWKDELDAKQQSVMEKLGFSEKFIKSFMEEMGRHNTEAEKRYRDQADQAKDQAREAIDDLERVENNLHAQVALLEQARRTIKQLEDESREQKKASEGIERELRGTIEKLDAASAELSSSNEHLRTEIAKAQLKVENGEVYVQEAKTQIKVLMEELKQAEATISGQAALLAKLEANKESDQQKILELQTSIKLIQQQSELNSQEAKATISELTAELKQNANLLSNQAATLAKYETNKERDQTTIAEMQTNINSLTQDRSDYRKLMEEANTRAQKAESMVGDLEFKLADQLSKYEQMTNTLEANNSELVERNRRIEQQEKIISKLTEQKIDADNK